MVGLTKAFLLGKDISFSDHTHTQYAASSHNHSASNITSGTLPIARGGTGATSASAARSALGAAASSHTHSASQITSGALPINRGGTGETTLAGLQSLLNLNNNTYLKWKNGVIAGNDSKKLTVSTGLSNLIAVFAIMTDLSAPDQTDPSMAAGTYWFWIYNFPYYIYELYNSSTAALKMQVSRSTSSGGLYQLEFRDTYLDGNGFQSDDRIYYLLLY